MKLSRRSAFMLVASAIFLVGSLPGVAHADALADIAAKGSVRIAIPQDFPPFGSVGPDMTPQGYDIDVANLIAEELGVEVEFVPVTSANRVPYLQTGRVDLVVSSLGRTEERAALIDFSDAYAPYYNGILARVHYRDTDSR